jgi:ribonuclease E
VPERPLHATNGETDLEMNGAVDVPAPPSPVAQFDVHPTPVDAESPLPREAGPSTDEPAKAEVPSAAPEAPAAPPRRRSTVREPAPAFGERTVAPAPSAEATDTSETAPALEHAAAPDVSAEVDDGRPRRTGWWSRRAVGRS